MPEVTKRPPKSNDPSYDNALERSRVAKAKSHALRERSQYLLSTSAAARLKLAQFFKDRV